MTEAAIDTSLSRDLYVSLGEATDNTAQTWSVRLYYKSFVVWIWLGGFIMALGGGIAMFDRRYRKVSKKQAAKSEQKNKRNDIKSQAMTS